ncbi:MAG TPA: CaiB/BaiF CoA-transferase family protein [Castellaniella sp.]|uniref:CaiB/BaiF CoA transferase family protein n=1 Tax=Castellaniella sp. TaxID=1955812 RepID=UPI002F226DD4
MKVLGLCHYLQGPAATQYLADLGADVIKVEPLTGAHERHWAGAKSFIGDVSSFYLSANRNKRSLAIDLKTDEGRDIMKRLAARSDALVENFRPGVLERMGLGYDALKSINPGLIYASATGFGSSGPLRDSPGQDLLIQARCGLAAGTGERFVAPKVAGAAIVDQHGGALLAMAVLAAYVKKLATGEGSRVESSLLNAGLDLQVEALVAYHNSDARRDRYRRHRNLATWFHEAPYGVYETKDARFVAIGLNDPTKLAEALGSSKLLELVEADRYDARDAYAEAVTQAVAWYSYAELAGRFDQLALWYAPVQDYEDLRTDPQVLHNQVYRKITVGNREVTLINNPVRYEGKTLPVRRISLQPGSDTRQVLQEIGLAASEIEDLVDRRIVLAAPPDSVLMGEASTAAETVHG